MDATDREGARRYLEERAYQALIDGFHPASPDVEPLVEDGHEWGARALARSPAGEVHQSVYVYAGSRGKGAASRFFARSTVPVVTTPDCHIEGYLASHKIPFVVVAAITASHEYRVIEAHYEGRRAERSGVPYMRHIDEGLAVLRMIGASERAMRAFCLHPTVQSDADLAASFPRIEALTGDPSVLALALEYRHIANTTLSHRVIASSLEIPLSPLPEVNQMLVADKVQNRKDFLLHHRHSHPRRAELDRYFRLWLERLGVSEERFEALSRELSL